MTEPRGDSTIPELLERAAALLDQAAELEISSVKSGGLLGIARMIREIEIPEP